MRCSDVTRELAVPVGSIESTALTAHLAGCPRCAAAAESARRFDRLWAETRPESPSQRAWDDLWARVEDRLAADARPVLAVRPMRRLIRFAPLAAAAALILGVGLASWFRTDNGLGREVVRVAPATDTLVEVAIGQTVLYDIDADRTMVVQSNESGGLGLVPESGGPDDFRVYLDGFSGFDDFVTFFNLAEAEFLRDMVAANDREPGRESPR